MLAKEYQLTPPFDWDGHVPKVSPLHVDVGEIPGQRPFTTSRQHARRSQETLHPCRLEPRIRGFCNKLQTIVWLTVLFLASFGIAR